ncbi:hypothetical protein ACUCL1_004832, partial [Escherichia coli]
CSLMFVEPSSMNTNIYKTPHGVFFWCVFGYVLGFVWLVTKDVAGLLFLLRRLTRFDFIL